VWEKKQQRKDTVKESVSYVMNYNTENNVAFFPELSFWMIWTCGVLTCRASYTFHVGKMVSSVNRNVNIFPNQESILDMLFEYSGKKVQQSNTTVFPIRHGSQSLNIDTRDSAEWPFQESWKRWVFDQ